MAAELTPTSYAMLGLLNVKPWSTHELASQMDRTLSRFWPRARSKLYEEPKKLVSRGLATSDTHRTGRRTRTVYAITAAGRGALQEWHRSPSAPPQFESEHVLKMFFADSATRNDVLRTLWDLRRVIHGHTMTNIAAGEAYMGDHAPFPQRTAINIIVGRFLDDQLEYIDRWAEWAIQLVEKWPEYPVEAEPNREAVSLATTQARHRAARFLLAAEPRPDA